MRLFDWAGARKHARESRQLGAAKCYALSEVAVRERKMFPIHRSAIIACVAGLNSRKWIDPFCHCCILENPMGAAPRAVPLGPDPLWD